jgi:putative tryptophan/tyrosine transport system substrate-binding protein
VRRRTVLSLLGGAAMLSPLRLRELRAQTKPARIGIVNPGDEAGSRPFLDDFRAGLSAIGYVDPDKLKMEVLFANNAFERISSLVEELERRRVDVIVTHGAATRRVIAAKRTAPAVFIFSSDPVSAGVAKSLAEPLFNATGISLMIAELNGKRLELLSEIAPGLLRVAVLANDAHPGEEIERAFSEVKARQLGLEIAFFPTRDREALERVLDGLSRSLPQAILLFPDGFIVQHRHRIIDFGLQHRTPVVSGWAVLAEDGALFTYGPSLADARQRIAYFVDRLLRGAKPADLPIEQPTAMELVINFQTARRLGLVFPPTLLVAANRIID